MMKKLTASLCAFCVLLTHGKALSDTLTLATLNWAPFYSKDLPENGFFSALSREAFKRAGFHMSIEFTEWNRAVETAKKGKNAGILGAYYNEERSTYFYYTDPVFKSDEVFILKKGRRIAYNTLEDLKPYKIGTLKGGAQGKELSKKGLNTEGVMNYAMNIKKLDAGRIDLVIMNRAVFHSLLENDADLKRYQGKFQVLEKPFKSYDLYCPISKKLPNAKEIVTKFNTALKEMKQDGTYQAILSRFGQQ